jgi:hypothetical protein
MSPSQRTRATPTFARNLRAMVAVSHKIPSETIAV